MKTIIPWTEGSSFFKKLFHYSGETKHNENVSGTFLLPQDKQPDKSDFPCEEKLEKNVLPLEKYI